MSGNGMVRPCSCPAQGARDVSDTAIAVIGIDIGKNSFHVVGHDARRAIVDTIV